MKKPMIRLTALLAAILLFAAGCGGKNGGDSSAPISEEPITSDVSVDESSDAASDASSDEPSDRSDGTADTTAAPSKSTSSVTGKKTDAGKTTTTVPVMDRLASAARWKQTRFYLSTFNATAQNQSEEVYRRCLTVNKEAGIQLIENSIMSTQDLKTCMDICEELGIDFLAQDISRFSGMGTSYPVNNADSLYNMVEEFSEYKHLVGYFLWDEPSEENFKQFKVKRDILVSLDPGSLIYSLLLPSYGAYRWDPAHVEDSTYKSYVDHYVEQCDPDVLSVDYYPFHGGTESLMENDLWRDIGYFRYHANRTGKPLWFYFQASRFDKELSDAQVQVQMYAALAYGVKGLSYYTTSSFLTDEEGNRTSRFAAAKKLNARVINLGNLLFDKKGTALYHTGLSDALSDAYSVDRVGSGDCPFTDAPDGLIISVFRDGNTAYWVVVNKNYSKPVAGTVELKKAAAVESFDLENGKFSAGKKGNTISLNIAPGGCAVYRLN